MSLSQPSPPLSPGWLLLARGEQENDLVSRCPAGHVHLDYGNLTIRFQGDEFLAFARMVAEAAARLQGQTWAAPANTRAFAAFAALSPN